MLGNYRSPLSIIWILFNMAYWGVDNTHKWGCYYEQLIMAAESTASTASKLMETSLSQRNLHSRFTCDSFRGVSQAFYYERFPPSSTGRQSFVQVVDNIHSTRKGVPGIDLVQLLAREKTPYPSTAKVDDTEATLTGRNAPLRHRRTHPSDAQQTKSEKMHGMRGAH